MKRKSALITGASRGIGKALALTLAAAGYDLILNSLRSEDLLRELSQKLEKEYGIQTLICCGDAGDESFVTEMFTQIKTFCGSIDVLINNAGISQIGLLSDLSLTEWNRILQTNLTAAFLCCKMAIPGMISQKKGSILNISSVWGLAGASCEVAYSATKGGLNAFTKALAKELAPSNIAVNAIACGVIDTEMNQCFTDEERQQLMEEIPAGRFATPQEVAELALSLIHSTTYLTGQIITLDGGWL